ncbi:MAG TPA: BMP family ABC transporter substrate-binding protein [Anaerolineales bacterium]|nr:BMP family ABC transporter substrate-binding protein [Anaerolineales bacterium]
MHHQLTFRILTLVLVLALGLAACTPAPTPAPPEPQLPIATQPPVEAQPPIATQEPAPVETQPPPAVEEPCLVIGALYVGSVNDAGYNQAMHDSLMVVEQNIPCVEIVEAENVYEGPTAETVMETMISEGAKLIFPTSFGHQEPAINVANKHPDVIFEHAGGWMMSDNFANFYGKPPETWYLMGIAAGMMTETNKLGFVAAMPLGWTLTFVNSFELGAQSVNPDAETIVTFTGSWSDRAKEAAATDALINQGVDVITMHVDSPATVIQSAEARGVYSIGFQSLAAQQFAPEYWITGAGFTLGGLMTGLAQSVIDQTWEPNFIRCGLADGCMAIAPYGPKVPEEVKTAVDQALAQTTSGELVIFKGPIIDQEGTVRVAEGESLSDEDMGNTDWFVMGVIGQPK